MTTETAHSVLFQRLLEHLKEIAVGKQVTIKDVDAFCGYWQGELEHAEGVPIGDYIYKVERIGTFLLVEVFNTDNKHKYSFEYDLVTNEHFPEDYNLTIEDLIVVRGYFQQFSH